MHCRRPFLHLNSCFCLKVKAFLGVFALISSFRVIYLQTIRFQICTSYNNFHCYCSQCRRWICTSITRPFAVITGSRGNSFLSTEQKRHEPIPDLSGAAAALPGTWIWGTLSTFRKQKGPFGDLLLPDHCPQRGACCCLGI